MNQKTSPVVLGPSTKRKCGAVYIIARPSAVSDVDTPCFQVSIGVRTSDKQEGEHLVNEGWVLHLPSIRQPHKGN